MSDPTVPIVWPVCSTCDTPYVHRKALIPDEWVWMRDCKHKVDAYMADANGRITQAS